MDCPICGRRIEIEDWEIWENIGTCKVFGKTYSIKITEIKENSEKDITNDFSLETTNDKRNELVKLNGLFDSLLLSRYVILEEFFVKNALEFLQLQKNMKFIQEKIKKNVPSLFKIK